MQHQVGFDLTKMRYVQVAVAAFVFLQFVMGYILVTRLVHADAVFGANMFWLTRPVSPARMLAAKVLGALLLFGLLPLLLLLPWWLHCGFGWREIGWEAVQTFGWQLLMIAPAFLVASLTDDLGRVLLWTLLLIIGLLSWIVLLHASLTAALGKEFAARGTDWVYTRICVVGAMGVVGSVAIAAHQYLTRRFVRSVVLVAAGLGAMALAGHLFPWNLTPGIRRLAEPLPPLAPAELTKDITFEVWPAQDLTNPSAPPKRGPEATDTAINLRLQVRGLPEGLQLGVENAANTWTWPNGISIVRRRNYSGGFDHDFSDIRRRYAVPVPAADPETEQWRKLKRAEFDARLQARGQRVHRWQNEDFAGRLLSAYVTLPNSFVDKIRKEPPAFTTDVQAVLYRADVLAELPLVAGARAAGGAQTFHLLQVRGGKPLLLTTRPTLPVMGLWNSGGYSGPVGNAWSFDQAVALNAATGDIDWVGSQSGSQFLLVAGVMMNWNYVQISSRWVIRDGKSVGISAIDPQWQDHTKLLFLAPEKIGRFTRTVSADAFTVVQDDRPNPEESSRPGKKP